MQRPNILLIVSDEHSASVTGYAGHPFVKTPTLDRLTAEGAAFSNAYCNSPMCVPSRMSFLAGRYSSQIGVYDNGSALDAEIPSFATYLESAGYETTLCGRMHMIGSDRTHGFGRRLYDDMSKWQTKHQTPRRVPEWRRGSNSHVTECGPGEGSWLEYDSTVIDLAERFLGSKAKAAEKGSGDKPWLMVAGIMFPHFPLICPKKYFDMYYPDNVVIPETWHQPMVEQHPLIAHLRRGFQNDKPLEEELQRRALASYYGLTTLVDEYVGRLVSVIDDSALRENTVIIYTSDHGEMGGAHGIWQKQCFYEEAVRVPLVARFPEALLPGAYSPGSGVTSAVSLVDIAPTLIDLAGGRKPATMPGTSLLEFLKQDYAQDRVVFSEYHAQGLLSGGYMIKRGNLKLNYYAGYGPELFDLETDPNELSDKAGSPKTASQIDEMTGYLVDILDPESTDAAAKADQKIRLDALGR